MSHLFTQWEQNLRLKLWQMLTGKIKIFGWHTRAYSKKYKKFLTEFSSELKSVIEELGLKDKTLIHVSDEPNLSQIFSYRIAANIIKNYSADTK